MSLSVGSFQYANLVMKLNIVESATNLPGTNYEGMIMTKSNSHNQIGELNKTISKDGTIVSFLSIGKGPGVIVIPGVLSMADDYAAFASALSKNFTVHTLERRGRGSSGSQGDEYSIQKEMDDVLALQEKTGASFLVGHSYGGLIALEVGRSNSTFNKIAVYEPGVSIDGSMPIYWVPGYVKKLSEKRNFDAFIEFALADAPAHMAKIPPWLMKWLMRFYFLRNPETKKMLDLLPQNLLEWKEIAKLDNQYINYHEISAPVMLLYGGRSNSKAVDLVIERLPAFIPHCETKLFPKLDHFGIERTAPVEVAKEIADFFSR